MRTVGWSYGNPGDDLVRSDVSMGLDHLALAA